MLQRDSPERATGSSATHRRWSDGDAPSEHSQQPVRISMVPQPLHTHSTSSWKRSQPESDSSERAGPTSWDKPTLATQQPDKSNNSRQVLAKETQTRQLVGFDCLFFL